MEKRCREQAGRENFQEKKRENGSEKDIKSVNLV
jgi:hypothetical protein